jgi:hypothetical protein
MTIAAPVKPHPVPQLDRRVTVVAWVVTILISALPAIAFDQLAGSTPIWLGSVRLSFLLLLSLLALIWRPLRPLRSYFLAMLAFYGLAELRGRVDLTWPALQRLFGNTVFDARMQAEQTSKLVVSLLMIVVLFVLGYRRREMFLTCGDLRAPIGPVPRLGFHKPVPWSHFGLRWGFCIAAALAVFLYLGLRPSGSLMRQAVPILPSILFYAALNAFNEEITFRVPMLATLESVGGRQALWMSAYFFGIAHYFGVPGGLMGGIASIFMGWILGKGILETRGLFWTWWIHFLADIAIFFFLTVALLG